MTNTQIIEMAKRDMSAGAEELAKKYGISACNAVRIAESIVKHDAKTIMKRRNKITHLDEILIGWYGHGYCGAFDTNTRLVIYGNEDMGIYGD